MALVPDAVKALVSEGLEIVVEAGAGEEAGFPDEAYVEMPPPGWRAGRRRLLAGADVVVKVQPPRERPDGGHEVDDLRAGSTLIGFLRPLDEPSVAQRVGGSRRDGVLHGADAAHQPGAVDGRALLP